MYRRRVLGIPRFGYSHPHKLNSSLIYRGGIRF